jgi:acetylornithine deacetylase/succinyl-diaminopimelate desuccinylase family protein
MINRKRLISLTQQLIAINSENPPGQEKRIAEYVRDYLRRAGVRIIRSYAFVPKRPNVLATIKGYTGKGSLLLSPHLDTVPAGKNWKHNPFKSTLVSGKLFGRGATDCKGNLAVCLEVVKSLIEDKVHIRHDIIIAATVDEETGSHQGIIKLLAKGLLKPGYALILDSDDFRLITCQKGLIHFTLKVFGKKAHGAYPDRGINAIELMARIICDLKKMRFVFKRHGHLKGPTINIGKICGGEKVNIVADYCQAEADLRFLPGMNPAIILGQIKKIIKKSAQRFRIQVDSLQAPYEISADHALVKSLLRSDRRFEVAGSEGATVITFFQKYHIPAVATGFGNFGCAHAADEYVMVDNLYQGAIALENFIKNFDRRSNEDTT